MTLENLPGIADWYNGQSIFLTGASGFLGKVLVYKLLKSCSELDTIYVLLRSKRGKTSKERLDDLFSSPIFDEFKLKNPELLNKVKMVEGDVSKPYLGIREPDWKMLQECVTIIFNAAASVRFDDSLQKAIFTNTRSTKHAILLAKGMKNLKAFVHVSTAFTNCNFSHIKEEVVPIQFDPEKLITAAEKMDEYELEIFTQKITGDYPNTYIFTKNIAEVLVGKERHNLPVIIYRPAIIGGAVKEPEPGWCDNFNGLTALSAAGGKGILRVFISTKDHNFDYIAVDACVNGMIVGAWYRSVYLPIKRIPLERSIVFNATDVKANHSDMDEFLKKVDNTDPLPNKLWTVYTIVTSSILYYQVLSIIFHVIPGFIVDGCLKLMGRKPMLMRIYRKLHVACLNLAPFSCSNWEFDTDNFVKLKEVVPQIEKNTFYVESLPGITLEELMMITCRGGRRLLGCPLEASKKDIEHSNRLYWIDLILRLTLLGIFIWSLPLKKTYDWSVDLLTEYQEEWNKFEAEYQEYKAKNVLKGCS